MAPGVLHSEWTYNPQSVMFFLRGWGTYPLMIELPIAMDEKLVSQQVINGFLIIVGFSRRSIVSVGRTGSRGRAGLTGSIHTHT